MDADVYDAALLLRFALQPRLLPARDPQYLRLVREWSTRPRLQAAAEAVADGLGITILAVDAVAGAVCWGEPGGPFDVTLGDFFRQARSDAQWGQRVVFAVALLASWRLCFPAAVHLDDAERVARFSRDELLSYVDGLCDRLDEAADAAGEEVDPPIDQPGLERAWRAWLRRSKTARTHDGRRSSRTTAAIVSRALEWMVEQGLLDAIGDAEGGTFRSRPRLRVLVREVAGTDLYAEVIRLREAASR